MGTNMRTDVFTLSLLMVAGTPAAAMAQGCTEAEAVLRAEAGILGPMLTEMTQLTNDYNSKQRLITEEYDYFYYYYLDLDQQAQNYIKGLEADKEAIKSKYDALMQKTLPIDAKVTDLVKAYETACSPNAKTTELLNEYDIVVLPPQ